MAQAENNNLKKKKKGWKYQSVHHHELRVVLSSPSHGFLITNLFGGLHDHNIYNMSLLTKAPLDLSLGDSVLLNSYTYKLASTFN